MGGVKRILLTVAYDGTRYSGFARQENRETIAGTLETVLSELTGETVEITGASRTDAGVHAYGNLAVFDTSSVIPVERFARILNDRLPEDIRITSSEEASGDYDPRKTGRIKTYEYRIFNGELRDPMLRLYTYRYPFPLDVDAMNKAAAFLVGEHDFTSFCNPDTQALTRVRNITACSVRRDGEMVIITVSGEGFLYNMVRIIAGTLMETGRGLRSISDIPRILDAKDRREAGFTAPPEGHFLIGYSVV